MPKFALLQVLTPRRVWFPKSSSLQDGTTKSLTRYNGYYAPGKGGIWVECPLGNGQDPQLRAEFPIELLARAGAHGNSCPGLRGY
ncbi:hypothetical protein MRS44_008838 [Fusarium solani]|uniref:uncharacterized protein n=1 Tax=Fusarium solani TaxID=169388 RepID=UPI0032C4757B|nr:hypothetical protein MRS44_008838 [Fusarium solani]